MWVKNQRYLGIKVKLREALYSRLEEGGEHAVPYTKKFSIGAVFRQSDRSKAAGFPEDWSLIWDKILTKYC